MTETEFATTARSHIAAASDQVPARMRFGLIWTDMGRSTTARLACVLVLIKPDRVLITLVLATQESPK